MKPSRGTIVVLLAALFAVVSASPSAVADALSPACQGTAALDSAAPAQGDRSDRCRACFVAGDPTTGPTFPSGCELAGVLSSERANAPAAD